MPDTVPQPFFAVDVGNSRIKIGRFDDSAGLESPAAVLDLASDVLENDDLLSAALESWLAQPNRRDAKASSTADLTAWWLGSVNWPLSARLSNAITQLGAGTVQKLSHDDLPLEIRVEAPDRVGIDRLLAAVAVNRLRAADRPAIVVDLGTAITVDLVAVDGAFEGGAILPGIAMAAQAMAQQTDALPQSPLIELDRPPPPIGKSTLAAIESGLFWGAIGAVRELIVQYSLQLGRAEGGGEMSIGVPELFLTGGAAPKVAGLLPKDGQPAHHVPHLVLSGIAVAAERMRDLETDI